MSLIDAPGQPFHDPEADAALFDGARGARVRRPRADRRSSACLWPSTTRPSPRPWSPPSARSPPDAAGFPAPSCWSASTPWRARREPIIGGGAGTGLSARCEQAGGIDLIVIYNSGRYRMAGRGSLAGLLAYGNANEIVVEMGARGAAGGDPHARAGRASTAPTRSCCATISWPSSAPWASPASRTSRPWACSTAPSASGPGGDRHGLRARGRAGPRRAPAGSAHHALCVRAGAGGGHGRGRRRHPGAAHGPDHGRRHRRLDRAEARRTARR